MKRRLSKKKKTDIGTNKNYKNNIAKYQNKVYKNKQKIILTPEIFNILAYRQIEKILKNIIIILTLILLVISFIYLNR